MKQNLLTKSAVALVLATTAITAVADTTVYGRFRAAAVCNDTGASNDDCQLENRSSRFGFKVKEDLGDGTTAFGRYEFAVNLDKGQITTGNTNRLAYVGVKSSAGEFSIGARWSPFYNHITSAVDATQFVGGTWQSTGYISTFRNSDSINYKNSVGGFKFGVQVKMDQDAEGDQIDQLNIGATFKVNDGISVGLGIIDNADEGAVDGTSVTGLNVTAEFDSVAVSGSFFSADDADALLVQATFGLSEGQSITAHFGLDMPDASGAPEPTVVSVEYAKKLSKNFRWFAGFESTSADSSTTDDSSRFGGGMRLNF